MSSKGELLASTSPLVPAGNGTGKQVSGAIAKKPRAKVRKASTVEIVKISDLLREHLISENGVCQYKDDWSDDVVARVVNAELNADHVSRVRREMFGNLYSARDNTPGDRIQRLEEFFNRLAVEVGSELRIGANAT